MAYALQSLIQVLQQDQHLILAKNPQIESLLQKTCSVRELVEKSSNVTHDLASRIRVIAHKAEDVIESHITDRILSPSNDQFSDLELTDVLEEFDLINEEILSKPVNGNVARAIPLTDSASPAGSSTPVVDQSSKKIVVGFEKDVLQLRQQLTGQHKELQVIPIVGMGGSGKTTLAQTLYDDFSKNVKHFDSCAWITISQEFDERAALLVLLDGLRKLTNAMRQENDDKLGLYVHQALKSRRYLIVVDDLWDTEAWDKLKTFFPDDSNSSRIIVTTRELSVVNYTKSRSGKHHEMHELDEDQSWQLLHETVFGHKHCSTRLEEIGRKIAISCKGLPLSIVVMGGLLSTSEKTIEFWELVERSVSSEVEERDSRCLEILSMSYNHLPYHLKPCFLYIGSFPEDFEIRSSKVVKLWISEGFLKNNAEKSLEESAETYLKALVDRNLIFVRRLGSNGNIRSFSIHDLLRKLSQKKAGDENFLWFANLDNRKIPDDGAIVRRVSAHPLSQPGEAMKLMSLVRSFLCIGHASLDLAPLFFSLRLMRVLDVFQLEFYQFPEEILELVLLRYLAFSCHSDFPSSISKLRNLQTLIVRRLPSFREFTLPSELWEMAQLRHVKSKETCLWYFPTEGENVKESNIQTLSNVQMVGVTNEVLGKIPNIRKLGLYCNVSMDEELDLDCLTQLERLKCSTDWSMASGNFLSNLKFPNQLKKLTFSLCRIPLGFMSVVGVLPNLEQLKLQKCDFLEKEWVSTEPYLEGTESEWEAGEDEFLKLISLVMEELNLVHWIVDNDSSFPIIQSVVIRECCSLEEIPTEIGERATLERIEIDECSPTLLDSAKDIKKEQEDFGNDSLQLVVYSAY